jgi:hypothetical protein
MDIVGSLSIVALAALIHASFQLSVSVLTILSGHAIGAKKSQARVMRLTSSYVAGAALMTILLLAFAAYLSISGFGTHIPLLAWSVGAGILFGIGISVWLFYYRKGQGTTLWIPRSIATYLSDRTKATKNSGEAFALGLMSVISEIVFIIGPLVISGFVLIQLSPIWQLAGIGIYTVISLLPLVIVWVLVGSGHALSRIQKWRETNKYFIQFAAGSGLIILGFYVYVTQVVASAAGAM